MPFAGQFFEALGKNKVNWRPFENWCKFSFSPGELNLCQVRGYENHSTQSQITHLCGRNVMKTGVEASDQVGVKNQMEGTYNSRIWLGMEGGGTTKGWERPYGSPTLYFRLFQEKRKGSRACLKSLWVGPCGGWGKRTCGDPFP